MKKWIFSLVLITQSLSAVAANYNSSVKIKSFSSLETEYVNPDSVETLYLKVVPMQVKGFDTASRNKLDLAFKALEAVVNSEEFKDRIVNFKNTKGQRSFASNNGKSNEEIYADFMEGRETLQPNTPNEMNFYLSLYNKWWSKVIGYTTPTTNVININWKFFKNYKPHEVAGNLSHEWVHKIGYDHLSASEHDSAPYAIGYIIEELAGKYLNSL